MTAKYTPKEREAAFWSKVKLPDSIGTDECWEWQGGNNGRDGYGRFRVENKKLSAHRIVYRLTIGDIPDGLLVCHTCDNPRCVNPDHLFLGTKADNYRDMRDKGRDNTAHGEQVATHKLAREDVVAIRDEYIPHKVSTRQLARKYGVRPSSIQRIISRQNWKHLLD